MTGTFKKPLLSMTLSVLLVVTTIPFEAGAQQPGSTGYSGQGAPLTSAELEQLAAPIALYPDALVAQILGAATFPDQVAYVYNWLQQNQNLTGSNLMQAVDSQPWDPSVKALTQFPSVLENLAKNLSWTSALGEAYHTQPADVMKAVQVLRAKAQAAGNLKTGSQITVVQQSPQVVVIQPTNPQVVYVPVYNPTVVYGYAYVTPGYVAQPATTAMLAFGVGIAVGAMMSSNGCCGWGYSYWNCNWHSTTIIYRGGSYYGNSAWHGGYYGSRGYGGVSHYGAGYNASTGTYARGATTYNGYGKASAGQSYNPSTGTYARGASVSNAYGSQSAAQAYNPRTGAYGATHQGSNSNSNWGSSTVSKNGQTVNTQHYSSAQGSVASAQGSQGGRGIATNSGYAGQSANGNKYATANGNDYKNTGSGWQTDKGGSWNNVQKPSGSGSWDQNAASHGWGGNERSGGSSAFGGSGGGWESRAESARGSASLGRGGGWGGRSGGRR